MARKHEHSKVQHCVSTTMFQEYIAAARLVAGALRCVRLQLCRRHFAPSSFSFFFPPQQRERSGGGADVLHAKKQVVLRFPRDQEECEEKLP